jgi:signal transduction histidine kinase
MVRERAISGSVTLETEISDDLHALHADERKLKQILVNLLSNAVKFTKPGGIVTLRTWCNVRSGYLFQIQDTGIGMVQEDIPNALAPFGQIDSALNRQYEGTGLGLPLSKKLTELHGGTLDLQSEPGVGTTVTLRPALADRLSATFESIRAS